jgi:hypothetical protein
MPNIPAHHLDKTTEEDLCSTIDNQDALDSIHAFLSHVFIAVHRRISGHDQIIVNDRHRNDVQPSYRFEDLPFVEEHHVINDLLKVCPAHAHSKQMILSLITKPRKRTNQLQPLELVIIMSQCI